MPASFTSTLAQLTLAIAGLPWAAVPTGTLPAPPMHRMGAMGTPLYTIGHGPLPFDQLLGRLQQHRVRTLLDVRSHPHSRRAPQYNRAELEAELVAAGIAYRWLGHHLGGRPLQPGATSPIEQPAEVAAGVTEAAGLAAGASSALLCAELDPAHCHRSTALAGRFEDAGFRVVHILADGSLHPHQPTLDV